MVMRTFAVDKTSGVKLIPDPLERNPHHKVGDDPSTEFRIPKHLRIPSHFSDTQKKEAVDAIEANRSSQKGRNACGKDCGHKSLPFNNCFCVDCAVEHNDVENFTSNGVKYCKYSDYDGNTTVVPINSIKHAAGHSKGVVFPAHLLVDTSKIPSPDLEEFMSSFGPKHTNRKDAKIERYDEMVIQPRLEAARVRTAKAVALYDAKHPDEEMELADRIIMRAAPVDCINAAQLEDHVGVDVIHVSWVHPDQIQEHQGVKQFTANENLVQATLEMVPHLTPDSGGMSFNNDKYGWGNKGGGMLATQTFFHSHYGDFYPMVCGAKYHAYFLFTSNPSHPWFKQLVLGNLNVENGTMYFRTPTPDSNVLPQHKLLSHFLCNDRYPGFEYDMCVEYTFTKDNCLDSCTYRIIRLRKKNEIGKELEALQTVNIEVANGTVIAASDEYYANVHGIFLKK